MNPRKKNANSNVLGMAWYIFFTKVRPWIAVVFTLAFLAGYSDTIVPLLQIEYFGVFLFALNLMYIVSYAANVVLQIVLFAKASSNAHLRNSQGLLKFIKGVLIYETILFPFYSALVQYYRTQEPVATVIICLILLALTYFVWYRCNMRYFRKRLTTCKSTIRAATPKYSLSPLDEEPQKPVHGAYNVRGSDLALEKDEYVPSVPPAHTPRQHTPVAESKTRKKFCSRCGKIIAPSTKKCTGCGKQYGIPWETVLIIVLSLLIVTFIVLSIALYLKNSGI